MRRAKKYRDKLKKIKLLAMDVDGVLTNGDLIWLSDGREIKHFHAHDGYGLALAEQAGIKRAILTARDSAVTRIRADMLHIKDILVSKKDKVGLYTALKRKYKLKDSEVAYIGDDGLDLPVIKRCGFGVCVANGRPEVKAAADYVTRAEGGRGAVREVVEMILKAQGKFKLPE